MTSQLARSESLGAEDQREIESKPAQSDPENPQSHDLSTDHKQTTLSVDLNNDVSQCLNHVSKADSSVKSQTARNPDRKWDSFRIKRDGFRAFSTYYKNKFKKFNKIWQGEKRNKKKKTDMHELVKKFWIEEFGSVVNDLKGQQLDNLIKSMIIILHSHRYNKGESFTQGLDFSIIRNLIYSYSQEARARFMEDEIMAFIFQNFCHKGVSQFVSTLQGKANLYVLEIEAELVVLQAESARTLKGVHHF